MSWDRFWPCDVDFTYFGIIFIAFWIRVATLMDFCSFDVILITFWIRVATLIKSSNSLGNFLTGVATPIRRPLDRFFALFWILSGGIFGLIYRIVKPCLLLNPRTFSHLTTSICCWLGLFRTAFWKPWAFTVEAIPLQHFCIVACLPPFPGKHSIFVCLGLLWRAVYYPSYVSATQHVWTNSEIHAFTRIRTVLHQVLLRGIT